MMLRHEFITRIDSKNKEVILIGVFNCDCSLLSNIANTTKKLGEIMNTYHYNRRNHEHISL